jgi:hypothetical protein
MKGLKLGFFERGISKRKFDFYLLASKSKGLIPKFEIISTVSSSPSFLDLFLVMSG